MTFCSDVSHFLPVYYASFRILPPFPAFFPFLPRSFMSLSIYFFSGSLPLSSRIFLFLLVFTLSSDIFAFYSFFLTPSITLLVLSCLALSCLVLSCLALPCLALPCLALPCLALPCLALPCLALPCLVLSCLVLSCLVLSCLVLSCLVLSCLVLSVYWPTLPMESNCQGWVRILVELLFMYQTLSKMLRYRNVASGREFQSHIVRGKYENL